MDVTDLLRRGGWSDDPAGRAAYDPLGDPAGAQELCSALADAARSMGPDLVVAWEEVADAVLAFLVAATLGVPASRIVDADGLVELRGRVPSSAAAVLVGSAFADAEPIRAVAAILEQHGSRLVGVVSLLDLGGESPPVTARALHASPPATR